MQRVAVVVASAKWPGPGRSDCGEVMWEQSAKLFTVRHVLRVVHASVVGVFWRLCAELGSVDAP